MPETADNADRPKQPARPWYRLHLSTCIVLVLLTAVLVLLIVPGDLQYAFLTWDDDIPIRDDFEHGWPLAYVRIHVPTDAKLTAIPWLRREAWSFAGSAEAFSPGSLAIDIVAALLLFVLVGTTFEWRRRRRRNAWQFTLWELLAFFVLVAALLAWWQTYKNRFQKELDACVRIRSASVAPGPSKVGGLSLFQFHAERLFIREYCGPGWLRKLVPAEYLSDFRAVVAVEISDTFADADLQRLRQDLKCFPNLGGIGLNIRPRNDSELTDAGLMHLSGLTTLERLRLVRVPVGNAGIKHLAGLEKLTYLNLGRTSVSDAGLAHLGGLRNLEGLVLSETQVSGEGLQYLARLERLSKLWLSGTPVNDAGLVHLRELRNLKSLWLIDTQVTDKGVDELRKVLPKCKIHCGGFKEMLESLIR